LREGLGCGFIPWPEAPEGRFFLPGHANCGTLAQLLAVNRKRMHIFYTGHVQGVGFRYTVKTVATGYEVTGSVRNLPDGRVELLAEGSKEELEGFRQGICESGLGYFIQKEDISWGEASNQFRGFEIVR